MLVLFEIEIITNALILIKTKTVILFLWGILIKNTELKKRVMPESNCKDNENIPIKSCLLNF